MKTLGLAIALLMSASVAHGEPDEVRRLPRLELKNPLKACAKGALKPATPALKDPFDRDGRDVRRLRPLKLKNPFSGG